MTITFHSQARKEFFEAAEYYEEQVVGLGDNFIDEVEKVLDVIGQQPASGTKITKTERRFLVPRFQDGMICSIVKKEARIPPPSQQHLLVSHNTSNHVARGKRADVLLLKQNGCWQAFFYRGFCNFY